MAAANQMNGEIHDGRRHCSVYPPFAIFSIRDKGMEEKLHEENAEPGKARKQADVEK